MNPINRLSHRLFCPWTSYTVCLINGGGSFYELDFCDLGMARGQTGRRYVRVLLCGVTHKLGAREVKPSNPVYDKELLKTFLRSVSY